MFDTIPPAARHRDNALSFVVATRVIGLETAINQFATHAMLSSLERADTDAASTRLAEWPTCLHQRPRAAAAAGRPAPRRLQSTSTL